MSDQEIHPMDGNAGNPNQEMVPHSTNETSVMEDAKAAMEAAMAKAEEQPPEDKDDSQEAEKAEEKPLDWEKAKSATSDTPPAEAEDEQKIGDLEPLSIWDATTQDTFRQLDKEAQEFVLGVANQASTPLQTDLDALAPWKRIADTWNPYFQQTLNGLPADKAIESLLNADMVLRTGTDQQKLNLLNTIINDYKIPLSQGPAPVFSEDLADDPVAQAVSPAIQQLMSQVNDLKTRFETQHQDMQTSQQRQAEESLRAWAAAVGDDGKPLRPHFPEVQSIMESLYASARQRGQATTLEQLYEMACRAHPDVWAKTQSAQKAAGILERQKSASEKSKASSSVSGSASGVRSEKTQINPNESAYDVARAAMVANGLMEG